MPSIIVTTTTQALEPALIERIAAIVPTHSSKRDRGWHPSPNNRQIGESSEVPRLFYLEIVAGDLVDGGLTGNGDSEWDAGLDIVTDYRAFEETEVGDLVEMDQADVYDELHNAINVVPGLTHVEIAGEPQPDGDEAEARYRYAFTVFYMRNRR